MNNHRSFRPTLSLVTIVLLALACGAPLGAPTFTPAPPTHTPIPPTATPKPTPPPTATAIPTTGEITGRASVLGADKPALIAVLLFDASDGDLNTILYDQPVDQTVTDSEGRYAFAEVQPGTYIVAVKGKGSEVSFCGNTPGLLEAATLDRGTWIISYMKIEEKFSVNAGEVWQQDIVIKCD